MTTLRKIAEASGTSVNAVSRVLNDQNKENRPSSIARAKKIRQVAQELGYRPNTAAKAMKLGVFNSVMLLKSSTVWFGNMPDGVLSSIQQALNSQGYKLMLTILPDHIAAKDTFPVFFKESCVDGMLISINRNIPLWLGELLDGMSIPRVWLGSSQENDCVRHEDFGSGYDAAQMLIAQGHRRVVYTDLLSPHAEESLWHFSVVERMEGYRNGMREAGLEPIVVRPDKTLQPVDCVDYVWEHLFCAYRPTAVVAYGMAMSGRPILYACARHRLRVPDDVSLITWNDEPCAENGIEISCYTSSRVGVGKVAAELLCELMQTPGSHREPCILPFDFSEGGSVAPRNTTDYGLQQ